MTDSPDNDEVYGQSGDDKVKGTLDIYRISAGEDCEDLDPEEYDYAP